MKNGLFWITIAAAVFGAWWVFLRRRPVAAGQLGVVAPSPGAAIDEISSYFQELVNPAPPGGLPPIAPPSVKAEVKSLAVKAGGAVGAVAATSACVAASGGPLCALAAPAGKIGGELAVKGGTYVAGKTIDAGKAIGHGAASVAKKLKFW